MGEREFKYRVLVVDDDPLVRETSALVLTKQGYEVRTSADGFAALVTLRTALPDLIIADLRMPNMSGFEFLSVVRRRFPHIPVIAISGEFNAAGSVELLADAFFQKGGYRPPELFFKIAELLNASPLRPSTAKVYCVPVWTPINERGYVVLTCSECLRSFSVPQATEGGELSEAECVHCGATVHYLRDLDRATATSRTAAREDRAKLPKTVACPSPKMSSATDING